MNRQASDLSTQNGVAERVIDLARWAPSGDNEQPWRFELIDNENFVVLGHDTREWCVYDLDGRASQIALGALLETIQIAASGMGYVAQIHRRQGAADNKPTFDVKLVHASRKDVSGLFDCICTRVTQRRMLSTSPLTDSQKAELEHSVGKDYRIIWVEGKNARWKMAKLLFRSAYIRLTIPEAYKVHCKNIEWNSRYSEEHIPDRAIGVDAFTLKIMRWTLESWARVRFMNRFLAGTLLPRLQMDLMPGFFCASHFAIVSNGRPETVDDFIRGGRAVQRFWLTATKLGLQFQPEMTPLIFSWFGWEERSFTTNQAAQQRAIQTAAGLETIFGLGIQNGVFMGRLGLGKEPESRSVRLPLSRLKL